MNDAARESASDSSLGAPRSPADPAKYPPHATLALALLPWPAVWAGLYLFHSVWATFFLYHAVCIGGWLFARSPMPPPEQPWWMRRHWVGLGAACFVVNTMVYLAAGLLTAQLAPERLRSALLDLGVRDTFVSYAALFVYFASVNPVAEELFWRATIYGRLREGGWRAARATAASSVLFGAWHWLPVSRLLSPGIALLSVVGVMGAGALFALLYERTRRAGPVMLLHGLGSDVPILVALWVDVLARH